MSKSFPARLVAAAALLLGFHVVFDANAGAAYDGGVLGFGGRAHGRDTGGERVAVAAALRRVRRAGFAEFQRSAWVRETADSLTERGAAAPRDAYASHPTDAERLAALEALPDAPAPLIDDRPALDLLRDVDELERTLFVVPEGMRLKDPLGRAGGPNRSAGLA